MSGLILKGDLIDRLGVYFPAPYIEKIVANYDSIEVRVSMMFKSDETEYFDELIAQLQEELYVYVALIYTTDVIANVLNKDISIFDSSAVKYTLNICGDITSTSGATAPGTVTTEILDLGTFSKFSGPSSVGPSAATGFGSSAYAGRGITPSGMGVISFGSEETDSAIPCTYNLIQIPFADFVKSSETIYDEGDNLIVRYDLNTEDVAIFEEIQSWITITQGGVDVTVFAFSSIIDYDTTNEGKYNGELSDAMAAKLANPTLIAREVSDLSYEPLFVEGKIVSGTETTYVDGSDILYDGVPWKALDGVYHKSTTAPHATVIDAYMELVDGALNPETQDTPIDPAIQSAVESLGYIVSTYGNVPNLLLKINDFRRSFPEKSSATAGGQFYNMLTAKLAEFNSLVKLADPVFKRRIRRNFRRMGRTRLERLRWCGIFVRQYLYDAL